MELAGEGHKITHRVMGEEMINILKKLIQQPPSIHDLKLQFESNLHSKLLEYGHQIIPSNHGIILKLPRFNTNITAKVLVYPRTTQVDIGCTFKPFVYDISGVLKLTALLGRITERISLLVGSNVEIPEINKWIVTHYHFGKDGKDEYNGQSYHRSYEEVANGFVRFYSKKMDNGTTIPRVEQIQSPHHSLDKAISKIIDYENKL